MCALVSATITKTFGFHVVSPETLPVWYIFCRDPVRSLWARYDSDENQKLVCPLQCFVWTSFWILDIKIFELSFFICRSRQAVKHSWWCLFILIISHNQCIDPQTNPHRYQVPMHQCLVEQHFGLCWNLRLVIELYDVLKHFGFFYEDFLNIMFLHGEIFEFP